MNLAEGPQWTVDPQSFVERYWGTTDPINIGEVSPFIFDSTGRMVSEFEEPNPANVPHDMEVVSFGDSRDGEQADASAFDALKEQFRISFGILSYLRTKILGNRQDTPSIEDLSQLLSAAIQLPDWYVLKADNPVKNGKLDPAIASVAKIARGLIIPMQLVEQQSVVERYTTGYIRFDDSFMQGPKAFYDLVNRKKLLVQSKACPAPPSAIIYGARILFGEKAPGTEDAEKLLGLSDREIGRVKDFGKGYRLVANESHAYQSVAIGVTPLQKSLYETAGITSPLQLKNITGQWFRKQERLAMKNMTEGMNLVNESLGRRRGLAVQPSDFKFGPSFAVKKGF